MEHSFNVEVAKKYGVDEAIFIHNLYFWILKNQYNNRHHYEGRYWSYNSLSALGKLFPYFTRNQIRRVIKNCIEKGAIIKGEFNQSPYDHTSWFTLTDEAFAIYDPKEIVDEEHPQTDTSVCENQRIDVSESARRCVETHTSLLDTDNKTQILNTDNKTNTARAREKQLKLERERMFEQFWEAYPKKHAKKYARQKFMALKPDNTLFEKMMAALEVHKKTDEWTKKGGQYIPNPSSWINQERWNDEIGPPEPPNNGGEQLDEIIL